MRMAYDTILSDYVDADTAAKGGGFEPYRYECTFCWEDVHICAADSRNQATHFRHRSGNNNIECENYLGNRSAIISKALSRRNTRDKIEFYFSSSAKMFSVGVRFNSNEISEYEHNGACFQVRSSSDGEPIISVPIRGIRFIPDVSESIPISKFSWEYYISSLNDGKRHKYEVFRKDARGYLYPSFFKIQAEDDDGNFQAKLIRTETIYTDTPYFIVFSYSFHPLSFQHDVVVGKVINFKTMDKDFAGVVVTFTRKTLQIEQQLEAWKYKLESNETLTLLWPPSPHMDGVMVIGTESAIVYSSFELQSHGNTNAHSSDISKLDSMSKISLSGTTKIYKKNAELILRKKEESFTGYQDLIISQLISKHYKSLDDSTYLYNKAGVIRLGKGTSFPLTVSSVIRHYYFGYLDCVVIAPDYANELVGQYLIDDILRNYKRTEKFDWCDFESLDLNKDAFVYVETCEKEGMINSAVKRFIEEGRI